MGYQGAKLAGNNDVIVINFDEELSEADLEHLSVMLAAFAVYKERNAERADVIWRRPGVRGNVFQLYVKAERAFREAMAGIKPNPDHFLDSINYAVFAYRLEKDLDGVWPWPEKS